MTERQAADAARRWEWAAAVRWFATRTFTEANARNWHAIADMIEAGDLTPWADQPEPAGPYVCQQPVGDENEWEPCANLRPCPWHDQPPAAPAEPSGAAPAAAGPHPDTPQRCGARFVGHEDGEITCDLPAGHGGFHEETKTGFDWGPPHPARRTTDTRLTIWPPLWTRWTETSRPSSVRSDSGRLLRRRTLARPFPTSSRPSPHRRALR